MASFGQRTAADVRDDDVAIARIAKLTGLTERTVRSRLDEAHGKTHVRNLFEERWPTTASQLGELTVAYARANRLQQEIADLTGATRMLVSRRLNATHGKRLVRNALWDCWPDEEAPLRGTAGTRPLEPVDELEEDDENELDEGDDDELEYQLEDEVAEPVSQALVREIGPGTLLSSRYDLRRVIGKGGFGTTYEAFDRLSGIDLVVKVPNAEDGGAIQRELRCAFRLLHPNICQAFPDRDDETGKPFLVLQHGGVDLAHRLAQTAAPFTVPLAAHVLSSIADALDYLHDRLLVHLDVSPSNILIDEEDVVRLTDFGASSHAREHTGPDGLRTILATTVSAMNLAYAAPEVSSFQEGRSRSDQYSLALVFCSLLEGRVFHTRYRPREFPQLSTKQNEAIARALSHHPEDRFESCGELARAIVEDLGRVPAHVLAGDLDVLSRDLLHRLERELSRKDRDDRRLGGVVLLGRGLERLLHASVLWMASVDGFDAEAQLKSLDSHASGLARATAGKIARTIMSRGDSGTASRREVATLVADLLGKKKSRLWDLINARNDIVHGDRPPQAAVAPAQAVADLLREHRRVAGW